jgi:ABC-type antimicrobial peptide transport system permease subunit
MSVDNKCIFLKNSNRFLSEIMVNEYGHLIDDYMSLPTIIISYFIDDFISPNRINIESMFLVSKTSRFSNFLEAIDYIKNLRKDSYFFIYDIDFFNKGIILKYADPNLDIRLIGYEHIRTRRIRDKKISDILE